MYCIINIESIRNNKTEESTKKINIERENQNGEKISIEGSLKEFKYTDTINKKVTIKIK